MLAITVVILALLVLACNGSETVDLPTPSREAKMRQTPQTIVTSKGSFSVPGTAFMDGRDPEASPPLTVMCINIWDAVPRQRVVCKLQHGNKVEVLGAKMHNEENRYYFRIRRGPCEGWVSEPFVSPEDHEPVGDQLFLEYCE